MQKCPSCDSQMKTKKTPSQSFYYCEDCGGRLIPMNLVRDNVSAIYFRRIESRCNEDRGNKSKRKCQNCPKNLLALPLKNASQNVEIDYCKKCDSLFFDVDELEKLPQTAYPNHDLSLPSEVKRDVNRSPHKTKGTRFKISIEDFGVGWSKKKLYEFSWKIIPGLMGLPVERENRLGRSPLLNYFLIGITSFISILGFYFIPELFEVLGLKGDNGFRFGGINFLSYWFVHANWYHLLSNLYFLWIFGDNVEDDLGKGPYIIMLVAGTLLGGMAQYLFTPDGEYILGGASGGISAIILFYILRFPRAKLAQMFLLVWIRIPAYVYAFFWLFLQWLTLQSQLLGETQVSGLAHTGGAIAGFLAWFIWRFQPED